MGRRISDGKSVKVAVPANTIINAGDFVLLDGFLGLAVQGIQTDADGKVISYKGETVPAGLVPAEITLNIEEAEYETKQIDVADGFNKGDKVYWDAGNKWFTTVVADGKFCGAVTSAKDVNNVIWLQFVGFEFPFSDTTLPPAGAVADLTPGNAQGVQAALGTGVVNNNNAITWTARKVGDEGNDITVAMVDPGAASQVLSVAVVDTDITVNLATDAGTASSGTTGVEGNNNGLTWTAQEVGVQGDNIVIVLEDPDDINQVLAITVTGTTIVASLATDGAGAITTTATQLKAAIEADAGASALVAVDHTGGSTGAAAVTDEVEQLSGGVDPAISSTAAQVIAAVNGNVDASALVIASNTGASTGAGLVAAVAKTNLVGGVDSEGQQSLVKINELLASLRAAGHLAI
jgi:hypothetical protein